MTRIVSFIALAAVIAFPAGISAGDRDASLGTNLIGISDWSGEWPFVDAFKTSRPWISGERYGCWSCGVLDLDEDGWVRSLDSEMPNGGQVARTLIFTHADSPSPLPADYPTAGLYTVLYDGVGTIEYGGMATKNDPLSSPGMDMIDVTGVPGSAIFLTLIATDPSNPIRNIRVLSPGGACTDDPFTYCTTDTDCPSGISCEFFADDPSQHRFDPRFLERVRPYRLLRFMDWMATNNSQVVDRAGYPSLASAHWWAVPPEVLTELANLVHADVWVTIPHQASDAFVTTFATTLRDTLDPDLSVYVEYSNEVWNSIFAQSSWVAVRGCEEYSDLQAGCDNDDQPGNGVYCEGYPWPTWIPACYDGSRRWFSHRSVEIFDLFEAVFGDVDRLIRVMASQTGNTWLHEEYLSFEEAWRKTDALATAPYFGGELGSDSEVSSWTLEQLFAHLQSVSVPESIDRAEDSAAHLAAIHPEIELIAYEGGQHLVGIFGLENDAAMNALFDSANRDPRMGELYTTYLQGWRSAGGNLFANFTNVGTWSKWGRFTLLEYQNQDPATSPKWQAVHSFMADNPCWWPRCGASLFADSFESEGTDAWSAAMP